MFKVDRLQIIVYVSIRPPVKESCNTKLLWLIVFNTERTMWQFETLNSKGTGPKENKTNEINSKKKPDEKQTINTCSRILKGLI